MIPTGLDPAKRIIAELYDDRGNNINDIMTQIQNRKNIHLRTRSNIQTMKATLSKAQNALIHALIAQLEITEQKATLINAHTCNRTGSTAEMTYQEATDLIKTLQAEKKKTLGKMQGKIIGYMKLMGYIVESGAEDLERINHFIANIGKNNPRKAELWYLRKSELLSVLNQIEQRYKTQIK